MLNALRLLVLSAPLASLTALKAAGVIVHVTRYPGDRHVSRTMISMRYTRWMKQEPKR